MVRQEVQPSDPRRVRAFAEFFKRYMSLSSLVVAALPIPLTAAGLIPTYQVQTKLLSTYATMLCFLMLGFIFSVRHAIARTFFPQVVSRGRWMKEDPDQPSSDQPPRNTGHKTKTALLTVIPAFLVLLTLVCIFLYHETLRDSMLASGMVFREPTTVLSQEVKMLNETPYYLIHDGTKLMFFYLGIFVFAESAFIIMAIKEYLQDLVLLDDIELIIGQ